MNSVDRMAIVGLDGATFDLIRPFVEAGELPIFRRLLEVGAHGPLRSTIHPISPLAWTTFMTGKNAGKHGIFNFSVKDPGSYHFRLTNGSHCQGPTLWRRLGRAGKRCIVINVPFTYPPEAINGVMISGFDAPRCDRTIAAPPKAYDEMMGVLGHYYMHDTYPIGRRKAQYLSVLEAEVANRLEIARYFVEHEAWDFFMIVVNATDLAQHLFWAEHEDADSPYRHLIRDVYKAVDRTLEEYWALFEDVTWLILSDHGGGAIRKTLYLGKWLQDQGWLNYREQGAVAQGIFVRRLNDIRRTLKRFLPRATKDWLKSRLPNLRNQLESYLYMSEIDWRRTQAFPGGKYGNVYINVKGREPEGTVEPGAEYEQLCDQIEAALHELRDPETGEPIVEHVHRRNTLYAGPSVELAPDLIVQWKDYAYLTSDAYGRQDRALFVEPEVMDATTEFVHSGTHRMEGILIATGPGIRPGPIAGARLMDVAPTVLHAFGLPVPADMDGRVLRDLFAFDRPVTYADVGDDQVEGRGGLDYTEEEEEEVVRRLRGLGYMD